MIIGIAGGTGSGKTTFALALSKAFGENVALIQHDSYYKAHNDLTYEERTALNYDHPSAFDNALLIEQLNALLRGERIDCPTYDYTQHNRAEETVSVFPAPVIIVEGILIFSEPSLRDLFDIKIFVDTDADVRILRRIRRDVALRGRDLDSVIAQYLGTVKPMHEAFVEPSKRYADVIVPEGGQNRIALDLVMEKIRSLLHED